MTPIAIILTIVRGIATLTHNHALGGGGIGSERTATLLETFAALVQGGEETWEDMKVFAQEIQMLVDQNGEPTRGQWEAMIARDKAVRQRLADNLAALEAPPKEELPDEPIDPPVQLGGLQIAGSAALALNPGDPTGGSGDPAMGGLSLQPGVDPPL